MKRVIWTCTAMAALLLGATLPAASASWQTVWSDEFNAAAGTPPNSGNWKYETGGGGWGNNELQTYTTSTNNARHDGAGHLIIEARRNGSGYTSARLNSRFSFTLGRVEARIAVPKGQGLWPAFWMLGTNIGSVGWPKCGEVDIMEHINTNDTNFGTIHWDAGGHVSFGGNTTTSVTAFHTYAIEWNASSINWSVDGRQYASANIANNINSTEEFHRPFFILLNLAVGGNWPGSPTGSTPFPAQYKLDWVRVSQFR